MESRKRKQMENGSAALFGPLSMFFAAVLFLGFLSASCSSSRELHDVVDMAEAGVKPDDPEELRPEIFVINMTDPDVAMEISDIIWPEELHVALADLPNELRKRMIGKCLVYYGTQAFGLYVDGGQSGALCEPKETPPSGMLNDWCVALGYDGLIEQRPEIKGGICGPIRTEV